MYAAGSPRARPDMATALRGLRIPAKQLQAALCRRPERWVVAAGGAGALAVLGIVCWWWRSRSGGGGERGKTRGGAGSNPASRPAVEPLLREQRSGSGDTGDVVGQQSVGESESSDGEIEEVLSRGALARLAEAKAAVAKQHAEADAAKAFFAADEAAEPDGSEQAQTEGG